MNSYLKILVIVVLSSISGYALYPVFNSDNQNSFSLEQIKQPEIDSSPALEVVDDSEEKVTQQKTLSNVKIKPIKTAQLEDVNKLTSSSESPDDDVIKYSYEKEELYEWSISHKNKLSQIIDENMPKAISSNMKNSLINNNLMLNEPLLKQDSAEDANWAYLMEQDLRAYITQHDLAAGFELLNISCKQLICDVIGIETEANTWFQIYRGFYSFPNIMFPKEGSKPINITRVENDIAYIYAQIMFQSSKSS